MSNVNKTTFLILILVAVYPITRWNCYGLKEFKGKLYHDTPVPSKNLTDNPTTEPVQEADDRHNIPKRHILGANNESGRDIECLSCTGKAHTMRDIKCYSAQTASKEKCADAEQCYTELHPQYIKRGCMLPGRLNRTFVCKCPLCNDKPAYDSIYYEYASIKDWDFDNNKRLVSPVVGLDLMCKLCETKGVNKVADMACKFGKNADYMVCPHKHICFTNIDDETDYVSRGCIELPVFNSMYYFCNKTGCNNIQFMSPEARFRSSLVVSKLKKPKKAFSSRGSISNSFSLMVFVEIIFMSAKKILFQ